MEVPFKNIIAVDIGSRFIKIMCGKNIFGRTKLQSYGTIETPRGTVENNYIKDTNSIANAIQGFIKQNAITAKEISFAIHGQDIIIRHTEVPILNRKNIRESIEWEVSQYLNTALDGFIMDFAIEERIIKKDKKVYEILMILVPKVRVQQYVDIAKALGLSLKTIDTTSNCISRILKNQINSKQRFQNIAVIDIRNQTTEFTILHGGKIFADKELQIGLSSIITQISNRYRISYDEAYLYLIKNIDFNYDDKWAKEIIMAFDSAFNAFTKIIQFYLMDKSVNTLDGIFLIGEGAAIKGLKDYISEYFKVDTCTLDEYDEIILNKVNSRFSDYKLYINTLGLLARKD